MVRSGPAPHATEFPSPLVPVPTIYPHMAIDHHRGHDMTTEHKTLTMLSGTVRCPCPPDDSDGVIQLESAMVSTDDLTPITDRWNQEKVIARFHCPYCDSYHLSVVEDDPSKHFDRFLDNERAVDEHVGDDRS